VLTIIGLSSTTWQINTPFPFPWPVRAGDGLRISADGVELAYILANYTNLPRTKGSTQIWDGDFAVFIINNLRLAFPLPAESKK
jgi:hypothetical protein